MHARFDGFFERCEGSRCRTRGSQCFRARAIKVKEPADCDSGELVRRQMRIAHDRACTENEDWALRAHEATHDTVEGFGDGAFLGFHEAGEESP